MSTRAQHRQAARRASRGRTDKSPKARTAASIVTFAVVIGIAVIAFVARKSVPPSATAAPIYASVTKGEVAPRFQVATLTGVDVNSDRISAPIMLEIFATWCPHCQRETQTIERLHRRLGDHLSVVAVTGSDTASDGQSPETPDDVEAFAQHFAVSYPMAYDSGLAVAKKYLQGGFPTIVFINRARRISSIESGEISLKQLLSDARLAGAEGR